MLIYLLLIDLNGLMKCTIKFKVSWFFSPLWEPLWQVQNSRSQRVAWEPWKKNEFNNTMPLCVNKMYQILSDIFEISFNDLISRLWYKPRVTFRSRTGDFSTGQSNFNRICFVFNVMFCAPNSNGLKRDQKILFMLVDKNLTNCKAYIFLPLLQTQQKNISSWLQTK